MSSIEEEIASKVVGGLIKKAKFPSANTYINQANSIYKLTVEEVEKAKGYLTAEDKRTFEELFNLTKVLRERAGVSFNGNPANVADAESKRNWAGRNINPKQWWRARTYKKGVAEFYRLVTTTSQARRMDKLSGPEPAEETVLNALASAKDDPEFHAVVEEAGVQPEDVTQLVTVGEHDIYYSGSNEPSLNRPVVFVQENSYYVYVNPGRNLRRIVSTLDSPNNISPIQLPKKGKAIRKAAGTGEGSPAGLSSDSHKDISPIQLLDKGKAENKTAETEEGSPGGLSIDPLNDIPPIQPLDNGNAESQVAGTAVVTIGELSTDSPDVVLPIESLDKGKAESKVAETEEAPRSFIADSLDIIQPLDKGKEKAK